MPIDTTPSTVATNALQAIPYGSLIGAPLKAAIEAQAMAAQTTWNFIQEVGLNPPDAEGNRSTVQTVFQYQKAGEMVNLVVPLLAIVPIPYIAIETISIDFIANISASSSSVTEDTSSESMGGEASIQAKIGWGPFSVTANFKANYSSKKDSKATQESKYSVEYTMSISVQAGQDSMPAGLATILNILQSSITEALPGGAFDVSPSSISLDYNSDNVASSVAKFTGETGLAISDQKVSFDLADTTLKTGFKVAVTDGTNDDPTNEAFPITVTTGSNGQAAIQISIVKDDKLSWSSSAGVKVNKLAEDGTTVTETKTVPMTIANIPTP